LPLEFYRLAAINHRRQTRVVPSFKAAVDLKNLACVANQTRQTVLVACCARARTAVEDQSLVAEVRNTRLVQLRQSHVTGAGDPLARVFVSLSDVKQDCALVHKALALLWRD
jgi:hypothetical protein